ncbi:MAG: hypothetical protein ACI9QQ_001461 [Myxococcota bacterium]|jgi:hypothetical protein
MTAKQHTIRAFNHAMRPLGFELARSFPSASSQYVENPEVGSRNFSEKLARIERGEPFEWPNMVALNQALKSQIGTAKRVVNIGAGTGTFEWHAASDSDVQFTASEFDRDCVAWCKENRAHPNISYCSDTMGELLSEHGEFDLAVSVDVVEHVADYASFLTELSALAPRALITTPNKARNAKSLANLSPGYEQHVREWTAGEFYWVLRLFYSDVKLFGMPDVYAPEFAPIGPLSTMTPLLAVCERD